MILIMVPLVAWAVAQSVKNVNFWKKDKKISRKYLSTDGGMPSAHAAIMASLTTALFFEGQMNIVDPMFVLSLFVSLIIFRDASSVRLETSKQAIVLNKLVKHERLKEHELKTLIGHTKIEVIAGVLLGILIGVIFYI